MGRKHTHTSNTLYQVERDLYSSIILHSDAEAHVMCKNNNVEQYSSNTANDGSGNFFVKLHDVSFLCAGMKKCRVRSSKKRFLVLSGKTCLVVLFVPS